MSTKRSSHHRAEAAQARWIHGVRGLLVMSEIALSLVLLVGAGLLIKSFIKLRGVETGFDPQLITTAQASLTSEKYQTTTQVWAFEQQVLQRISSLPGVTAAATSSNVPMERGLRMGMRFEGPSGSVVQSVQVRAISPQYFRALGMPVLRGREFGEADMNPPVPVIIINETLAHRHWSDRDPLGQQLALQGQKREIIGVVRDIKEMGLDQAVEPTVYLPVSQMPDGLMRAMNGWFLTSWIVRTAGPIDLTAALRQAVKDVDPQMPVASVRPLTQVISTSYQSRQFILLLMGIFAGFALVLTAVGIYGVLSYQVSQRTNEIGIRMALGAQTRDVLKLVIGQGMRLTLIGVVIGLGAAYGLTRLISNLLFGVTATDPTTFAVIALLLASVAFGRLLHPGAAGNEGWIRWRRSAMSSRRQIYFAGSIRGGRQDQALYLEIIERLKKYGEVLTEHIGDAALSSVGEDNSNQYIHERDLGLAQKARITWSPK